MAYEPKKFRQILGHFAAGVTVVTVKVGNEYHGMTANAVSSVSLVPPLVLCCVDHRTRLHRYLDSGQVDGFAISFLGEDQVALSNHFASITVLDRSPFESEPIQFASSGAPILSNGIAWVDCRLHSKLIAGDHTIYVGEVLDLDLARAETGPLIYYKGKYGTVKGV